MDLEETEPRDDCAGEDQQQFNRPTDKRTSLKRVFRQTDETEPESVMRQLPCRRHGRRSSSHCCKPLRRNAELVVRHSPASKDVNTGTEEATFFETVTKQNGEERTD
jgi:hypothetical protein